MQFYNFKIVKFLIIVFIMIGFLFAQKIGTDWINVKGMDNDQIENLMRNEIQKLKTYTAKTLDEEMQNMIDENDDRIDEFNSTKLHLRTDLNTKIDNKNDFSIEVNDISDELNFNKSELNSLKQKITDADSSSFKSQSVINSEKRRVEDELTKIPFYEVMIARIKDFPENANATDYDAKMGHEIARMAIESQRGLKIINETIVSDNTLTKERVKILLQGKANENLKFYLAQRPINDNEVKFDRYRYGVVTIYPFQDEKVDLQITGNMKNITCEVEVIKDLEQGLVQYLPKSEKRKLSTLMSDIMAKNTDSEDEVKRLAKISKRFIDQENRKIERNNKTIIDIKNQIYNLQPNITSFEKDLNIAEQNFLNASSAFEVSKTKYESHVYNESYVEVFPWEGRSSGSGGSITEQYIEFGIESFHEFLSSIRSEYIREETNTIGNSYSDIKESKKTNVVINEIKFLGKFAEQKGRFQQLSIYIAYNYGFEFEQDINSDNPTVIEKSISSTSLSRLSTNTKKASNSKKNNLKITSSPSGADIFVSGRKIGSTPFETYFFPGTYSLVLKKEGFEPGIDLINVKPVGITNSNLSLYRTKEIISNIQNKKTGSSMFRKQNIFIAGGVALIGGVVMIMNQQEEKQETGSVSISIDIP